MLALGIWLKEIELPEAASDDDFKAVMGIPGARIIYHMKIDEDSWQLWFGDGTKLSGEKLITKHILLAHANQVFDISWSNLPTGGHLMRLEKPLSAAYLEALRK